MSVSNDNASSFHGAKKHGILIVDLGTQYAQLIARRVREAGAWSEIHPVQNALKAIKEMDVEGIILSGGPSSVYGEGAPQVPDEIFEMGVPVLGICYGMQWMCRALGGSVEEGHEREFGRTNLHVDDHAGLLQGVPEQSTVWMSHGDKVTSLPNGFSVMAHSADCPFGAVGDPSRRLYGVQFHPEVAHSEHGARVLRNFVLDICGLSGDWQPANIAEHLIEQIKEQVGEEGEVILGLSGGVDSSVAAVLMQRAIGDRLHCIFVDNGLLRHGEREAIEVMFGKHFGMDLTTVDGEARFLEQLAGVTDPETKRKRIGHEFVEIFREEAKRFKNANFLGQGTLYPDVIESVAVHGGNTAVIKSHHNVGGLPEDLELGLVEPLRELFKDEVRAIGRYLGLDDPVLMRQPFPGPGLAVRIVGEVNFDRCEMLRKADHIVTSEIEAAGAHKEMWQYFAVLLPLQSVGVMGDARTYEYTCAIRLVESSDGMTADWGYLERDLLRRISSRIVSEVRGFNRVVLDISSKPPATIEWE